MISKFDATIISINAITARILDGDQQCRVAAFSDQLDCFYLNFFGVSIFTYDHSFYLELWLKSVYKTRGDSFCVAEVLCVFRSTDFKGN